MKYKERGKNSSPLYEVGIGVAIKWWFTMTILLALTLGFVIIGTLFF